MRAVIATLALGFSLISTLGHAADRQMLGYGRIVNNDFIGDGNDRGHTGDVSSSRIWGFGWDGARPQAFGDLIELRISGGIIAPANLVTPDVGDRPYANYLSVGLHSHFARGPLDFAFGTDLVATGPQTRLSDFQSAVHDSLGIAAPSQATLGSQVSNNFYPTIVTEVSRDISFGANATLRPFVEARLGVESLVRVGFDMTLGEIGRGELLVRDSVTGQQYSVVPNTQDGKSFVLGGDIAHVRDSAFLPSSRGYSLTDARHRLRAGMHWQGEKGDAFYGVTWLGKEFEGQANTQLVGSMRLNLRF